MAEQGAAVGQALTPTSGRFTAVQGCKAIAAQAARKTLPRNAAVTSFDVGASDSLR
jgi:hypothetical protein